MGNKKFPPFFTDPFPSLCCKLWTPISWSDHGIRSCLIAKSKSTLSFESKKVKKILVGTKNFPPFLQNRSSILTIFGRFCRQTPQIGPHNSARRTFFQKSQHLIVVLRWTNRSPERKCSSSAKRPILTKKTAKSAVFAQFGLFFSKNSYNWPILGWVALSL